MTTQEQRDEWTSQLDSDAFAALGICASEHTAQWEPRIRALLADADALAAAQRRVEELTKRWKSRANEARTTAMLALGSSALAAVNSAEAEAWDLAAAELTAALQEPTQ